MVGEARPAHPTASGCRRRSHGGLALGCLCALLAACAAYPASASGGVTVTPTEVGIDLFYNGATLVVSGVIPAGHQAAMLCIGKGSTIEARRKGRVWGVLWMNTGDVTFEDVPSVYLLATSAPLAELASPAALANLGLGFDTLEARVFPGGGPDDGDARFRELVHLKERDGLFGLRQGAIRLSPEKGGDLTTRAEFVLPPKAAPGTYEVRLYSFRDGVGRLDGSASVTLRGAGMARFVAAMAQRRGLLYGVVSALVAMGAGLLAGLIFGLGRRRAH